MRNFHKAYAAALLASVALVGPAAAQTTVDTLVTTTAGAPQTDIRILGLLTFSQRTNGNFNFNLSGPGGLTVTGGGTITLGGTNTYSGLTTVSNGSTLVVNTRSLPGNVALTGTDTDAGRLVFLQDIDGTFAGLITGTDGIVQKQGAGTLTLSAQGSAVRILSVDGGTLNITGSMAATGNNSAIGTNLNAGRLQVDGTLATNIISTRANTDLGVAGTLTANRMNLFGGATIGGTVVADQVEAFGSNIAASGSLQARTLAINSNSTLDISGSVRAGTLGASRSTMRVSGSVTATDQPIILNDSSLVLAGGTVNGGLELLRTRVTGTGDIRGNVNAVGSSVTASLTGRMNVTGNVGLSSDSYMSLNGGSIGGGVTVTASTLQNVGTIQGGLTVSRSSVDGVTDIRGNVSATNGSVLFSIGSIAGSLSTSNSTVRPGVNSSPGTLRVGGPVSLSGGDLIMVMDGLGTGTGPGNTSRLVSDGTVSLATNLTLVSRGIPTSNTFVPQPGQRYRLVDAAGGVTGRFGSLNADRTVVPAGYRFNLEYGTTFVEVALAPERFAALPGVANQSASQSQVGAILDRNRADATARRTGDTQILIGNLYYLPAAEIQQTLDQLSAVAYAQSTWTSHALQRLQARNVASRLSSGAGGVGSSPATGSGWSVWGASSGEIGKLKGDSNEIGGDRTLSTVTVGLESNPSERAAFGLALGYGRGTTEPDTPGSRGKINSFSATLYGALDDGTTQLSVQARGSYQDMDVRRRVNFGTAAQVYGSDATAWGTGLDVQGGFRIRLGQSLYFKPILRGSVDYLSRKAATEQTGMPFSLALSKQDYFFGRGDLEGRVGFETTVAGMPLRYEAWGGYGLRFGDRSVKVESTLLGRPLETSTPKLGKGVATAGLNLAMDISESLSLTLSGQGEGATEDRAYSFGGSLRYRW